MDESAVSVLKSSWDTANGWSEWSTLTVVIGVIIDLVVLFIFSKDMSRKEKASLIFANILVIAGCAGEYVFGSRATSIATQLQQVSDEKVAALQSDAKRADIQIATAQQKAAEAVESAANLGVSFNNLHDFVADQERRNEATIGELKRNTAELNKARNDAVAAAEGTKKTLSDMSSLLDKQRALQQQMVTAMKPRDLSPMQRASFVEHMRPFKGLVVIVARFQASSPDSPPLANLLLELLGNANWTARGVAVSVGSGYATGVGVIKRADANPSASAAASLLIRELIGANISAGPSPDFTGNGMSLFGSGMMTGFNAGPPFPDIIVVVGDKT